MNLTLNASRKVSGVVWHFWFDGYVGPVYGFTFLG